MAVYRVEYIRFHELRFDAIRAIRRRVFVEEQGVSSSNEFDAIDQEAVHFLAWQGDEAVGTARLFGEGATARIGRVAVLANARGCGAGRALMEQALAEARRLGYGEVVLHAQTAVSAFYERLGFAVEGPVFVEEGIAHCKMRLRLCRAGTPGLI